MLQSFVDFLNTMGGNGLLHYLLLSPLVLIGLDFITGVGSALKNGTFKFESFADILGDKSDVRKYVGGAIALFVSQALHIPADASSVAGGVGSATLDVVLFTSIVNNIIEFFPASVRPEVAAIATEFENEVKADLSQVNATPDPTPSVPAADQQATMTGIPVPMPGMDLSGGTAVQNMGATMVSLPVTPIPQQQQQQFKIPSGF